MLPGVWLKKSDKEEEENTSREYKAEDAHAIKSNQT